MEITIIGWYGTETIGDRAILAGIIRVMSEVFPSYSIRLGSLYPFYTERTLHEDQGFYNEVSLNKLLSIAIFDSKDPVQLRNNIKHSDLLVVGGGPLMDLKEMNMLEYAFLFAQKRNVKTMLLGCGWGPLKNKNIIEIAARLVELSDGVVFRDEVSLNQCLNICPEYSFKINSSIDPAFFACDYFNHHIGEEREQGHIAINFRDVSLEGDHYTGKKVSEEMLCELVRDIAKQTELPVNLIPMHNFFIGGDDRVILNRVASKVALTNVKVIQSPMSLYDTMGQYYHAKLCVGMRFHAVVLQTMLNGNNYVVDYTDPSTGKIVGMMKQMNIEDHYRNRYYSLHTQDDMFAVDLCGENRFGYDSKVIEEFFSRYVNCLRILWP